MPERMFGIESEYALAAIGHDGAPLDHSHVLDRLMTVARRTLVHVRDHSSPLGIFLQNGSRFYVDSGWHPEFSTCEVLDPWDACRYVLAGERILAALAEQTVAETESLREIFITRCNVCYGGDATTWGCHESYAHRAPVERLREELVPHLVSRIIYTGSGGFDNRSAKIRFMISPRVAHLERVVSDCSTATRGIYHTKNEALSNGYQRLHVLTGESLCSQTASFLKTGVTALVVALIEAGLRPCSAIQLHDPLAAMKRFAVDTTLSVTAKLKDGRSWTALEMQQHILQQIEAHLEYLPTWAADVCRQLRRILDRLEQGPAAVSRTLDWAIKLAVFQEMAHKRAGLSWESVARGNALLARHAREEKTDEPLEFIAANLRHLLGRARIVAKARPSVVHLHKNNVHDSQLDKLRTLRQEMFELDFRFGQLGERGVFAALDRAGTLDHAVPGVDNIEAAMTDPPAAGRARLRGNCVRRLHGAKGQVTCDWMAVYQLDADRGRRLNLSDPFAQEEKWEEWVPTGPLELPGQNDLRDSLRRSRSPHEFTQEWLARIGHQCNQGGYDGAFRIIEAVFPLVEFDANSAAAIALLATVVEARERSPRTDATLLALDFNNVALVLRKAGRLDAAELLLRRALVLDENARGPTHPKRCHRTSNLATVLVMKNRLDEAKQILARVWPLARRLSDLTTTRILFVRLTIALLDSQPADQGRCVGLLKTLLAMESLPDHADVSPVWDMAHFIEHLSPQLPPGSPDFLTLLAATLNDRAMIARLARFEEEWSNQPPLPLEDTAWPDEAPVPAELLRETRYPIVRLLEDVPF